MAWAGVYPTPLWSIGWSIQSVDTIGRSAAALPPWHTPFIHHEPHHHPQTAIIGYIATNIDSIREKQKVAVEKTMTKQANGALPLLGLGGDGID